MNKTDQLFSEKLKTIEITPSDRANLLFQDKISKDKRKHNPVFKYWGIAASLVLLVGIAWYIGLMKQPDPKEIAAAETKAALPKTDTKNSDAVLEKPTAQSSKNVNVLAETQKERIEISPTSNQDIKSVTSTEIVEETSLEMAQSIDLKLAAIDLEKIELTRAPILNTSKFRSRQVIVESEHILDEPFTDFNIENKTFLARLVDEVRFLIKGDEFDLDRSGIKPLMQEKSALFVAETENFGIKIKELFN